MGSNWTVYVDGTSASSGNIEGTSVKSTGETIGKVLRADGDNTCSWVTLGGGGDALVANPLSQFAATTSLQLKGTISDETGSGALVFGTAPTFTTSATVTDGAVIDSDGIDLVTGNDYEINNVSVLDATTLGSSVVNSSLTGVGTLGDLKIGRASCRERV